MSAFAKSGKHPLNLSMTGSDPEGTWQLRSPAAATMALRPRNRSWHAGLERLALGGILEPRALAGSVVLAVLKL